MYKEIFNKDNYNAYENMKNYFVDVLIKVGERKIIKKGSHLTEDFFVKHYGILYSGSIKQVIINISGDEKILFIYRPGEMIGEFISTDIQLETNFLVLKDCELYLIDKEKIELTPEFFNAYNISITRKYAILFLQSSSIYFDDPLRRIANLIFRTAFQCGGLIKGDLIQIDYKFSHEEIAKLVGTSRVTVTRKMKILKEMELIEIRDKKIIIKNLEKLQALINF